MNNDALPKHFAEFAHKHFEGIRKEMSSDHESMYQRLLAAANRDVTIRSTQVKAALYAVAGVLCDKETEQSNVSEALEYLHALLASEQDASYKVSMDQVGRAILETRMVFDV